ncbi:hypothetical protein T03_18078 [Trichinella britovi]|uniref:Uncharacterized protein n=1 Tax=Trichinella britovi TaxID=45882 RepID=A0A0V1D9B7_TRIBR|nr:hypothetical protein T03_18078 [Trichinella britovi]
MKLIPFATPVRMDVKAFPSRPSVPLLITNSIVHHRLRRDSRVALVPLWIMSSHEARTAANQCSQGFNGVF